MKILGRYGLENAIPSPNDHVRTSYVVISRGKSRFVDEVHIPNAALRSSQELLTELQKSDGKESCEEQGNTSIQEIGAIHVSSFTSNRETCANTLSIPPTQPFPAYKKSTILRMKGNGRLFLPIPQTEEIWQWQSSEWLLEWCVILTKMSDNLTAQCIGTQSGRYC